MRPGTGLERCYMGKEVGLFDLNCEASWRRRFRNTLALRQLATLDIGKLPICFQYGAQKVRGRSLSDPYVFWLLDLGSNQGPTD